MLRLDAVDSGYDSSQVLFGLTLDVAAQQVASLIGRNGMGKTTTVRTIMGMLPVRGGRIAFEGCELAGLAPNRIARRGIGLVPEGRRVFGSLSVEENLLATARVPAGAQRLDLERVMTLFPRLGERRRQSRHAPCPAASSRCVGHRRALMTNPACWCFRRGHRGLAPLIRHEIWGCLRTLKREGLTIVVIDKNLTEMASLLDRHHIVEKGRVVWSGTPDELNARKDLAHRYLGI